MHHSFFGRYGHPLPRHSPRDRARRGAGHRRCGADGADRGGVRLRGGAVVQCRDVVPAGAALCRHHVVDRLGVGLLDPAQPQAGVERESETVAGARKRQ